MRRITSHSRIAARVVAALLAASVFASVGADAATGSQAANAGGAALLRSVQTGSQRCGDLSRGDFAAIGEYTMGRMMGSARGHEAMDRLMSTMMGERSERRVHEVMGRRFAGCGGQGLPGGFGRMMGAVNAMGMMGGGMMGGPGGAYGPGVIGGRGNGVGPGDYSTPGSMMGRARSSNGDADHMPAGMWILMIVLVAAVLIIAWALRTWRPQGRADRRPLDLLNERYAAGQIDTEEYRRRRSLLEGSR